MRQKAICFVDRLRIFVKSGSGSAGNPNIRGKGGDGGSVFLTAVDNIALEDVLAANPKKRFIATSGRPVSARRGICLAPNAKNLEVRVPVGLSVSVSSTTPGGSEQRLIGELNEVGQRLLVAKGGCGGLPITNYLGGPGQARSIVLDLKLMADVGLIGLPNAGKSSLLQALSGTKTKIASYPFTTLRPQIAKVTFSDHRVFTMTDLPGLADIAAKFDVATLNEATKDVAGNFEDSKQPPLAHTGFLKHLERTSCILVVLDALGFRANQFSPFRSPLASALLLVSQLQRYSHGRLRGKPLLCAINKIDLPSAEEAASEVKEALLRIDESSIRYSSGLPEILLPQYPFRFEEVFIVSAKARRNLTELKTGLRSWLDVIERRRCENDLKDSMRKSEARIHNSFKESLPQNY